MQYNKAMRRAYIVLIFGAWVAVLPYLGFPYSWKNILSTISGLFFVYLGYVLLHESKVRENKEHKTFDNFKENRSFNGEETQ